MRYPRFVVSVVLLVSALVVPTIARAGAGYDDGTGGQSSADQATLGWGGGQLGGWQAWANRFASGDLAKRPYVSDFAIVHEDGSSTTVFSGKSNADGITNGFASASPSAGDLGVVITPYNTCSPSASEQAGVCYYAPNRVAFTVVYARSSADDVAINLADPKNNGRSLELPTPVTSTDKIDLTIHLGQIGTSLRWSWIEGRIAFWNVSVVPGATSIDSSDTVVHLRASWGDVVGIDESNHKIYNAQGQLATWTSADRNKYYRCTATPIDSCDVNWSDNDGKQLTGVFSLDSTLSPLVAGAVFATSSATFGYADVQSCLGIDSPPGVVPNIQYQVAAPHKMSDRTTLRRGDLQAWLPSAALIQCYQLPSDTTDVSAALTAIESQRPASDAALAAPVFTGKTLANDGMDAVEMLISNMTFSARKPNLKLKNARPVVSASVGANRALAVSTTYLPTLCARGGCKMSVYGKVTTKAVYPLAQTVCNKFGTGRTECRVVGPAVDPRRLGACLTAGLAKSPKNVSSCYLAKTFGATTAIASYGSRLTTNPVTSSTNATMSWSKVLPIVRGDRVYVSIARARDNKVLVGTVVTVK